MVKKKYNCKICEKELSSDKDSFILVTIKEVDAEIWGNNEPYALCGTHGNYLTAFESLVKKHVQSGESVSFYKILNDEWHSLLMERELRKQGA